MLRTVYTTIKDIFNDFFNLVLVCKDIELRYGRANIRGFLSTVTVLLSLSLYVLSMNFFKPLFSKFS